jgi:hypothetical protein
MSYFDTNSHKLEYNTMKASVYHGPMDVRIDDKPKPKIQQQEDS